MESRKLSLILIFTLTSYSFVLSQPVNQSYVKETELPLSKNPVIDSQQDKKQGVTDPMAFFKDETKSPIKAAIFSAVIPGSGEWYSESYKSAIGFFAAEVIFVGTYLYYDKVAADKELAYHKVANDPNTGWSVRKYADYLIYWAQNSGAQFPEAKERAVILSNMINSDPNVTPGNRAWWNELNALEREMKFEFGGGAKFSHVLPSYNTQQYYELIGKYEQFNPGWWDYNPNSPMSNMANPTSAFISYRNMRTKANDMHNMAYTFLVMTVLNHSFSAINAALQAHLHNQELQLSLGSLPTGNGYRTPALNVCLNF